MARTLAQEGANIMLNDVDVEALDDAEKELSVLGKRCLAIKADVSKKDEVDRLVSTAIDTFNRVDVLVSNAMITRHAPLLRDDRGTMGYGVRCRS